jgi:hypothetical protein
VRGGALPVKSLVLKRYWQGVPAFFRSGRVQSIACFGKLTSSGSIFTQAGLLSVLMFPIGSAQSTSSDLQTGSSPPIRLMRR